MERRRCVIHLSEYPFALTEKASKFATKKEAGYIELGYTGDSLAEEMNVEFATISRIYRGLSVKIEYICELSEILNVSTDYLLKGFESDIELDAVSNRVAYMEFLAGLSDKELEQTVMHAKITLGIYSGVH